MTRGRGLRRPDLDRAETLDIADIGQHEQDSAVGRAQIARQDPMASELAQHDLAGRRTVTGHALVEDLGAPPGRRRDLAQADAIPIAFFEAPDRGERYR